MNSLSAICRFLMSAALVFAVTTTSFAEIPVDFSDHKKDSIIRVTNKDANTLQITWPTAKNTQGEMLIDLRPQTPLIQSLSLAEGRNPAQVIATQLDPVTTLTIGERDKKKFDEAFR